MTIFGFSDDLQEEIHLPFVTSMDSREKLEWERELLGIYLSDHPLSPYTEVIKKRISYFTAQLNQAEHNSKVVVAGMIEQMRTILTKNGKEMAFATMEDIQGSVELVIFPRTWAKHAEVLRSGEVLLISGKADTEKSDPKILVDKVEILQLTGEELENREESLVGASAANTFVEEDFLFTDPEEMFTESMEVGNNHNELNSSNLPAVENSEEHPEGSASKGKESPPSLSNENGEPQVVEPEHSISVPVEEADVIQDENRKVLLLQLASCGSKERDIRRLKQLYGFLTSTPGNDHFAFICEENGQSVRLDFPNVNTYINDSLLSELKGIVGESNVMIE